MKKVAAPPENTQQTDGDRPTKHDPDDLLDLTPPHGTSDDELTGDETDIDPDQFAANSYGFEDLNEPDEATVDLDSLDDDGPPETDSITSILVENAAGDADSNGDRDEIEEEPEPRVRPAGPPATAETGPADDDSDDDDYVVVTPIGDHEFVCGGCYLIKNRTQLTSGGYCRDCI